MVVQLDNSDTAGKKATAKAKKQSRKQARSSLPSIRLGCPPHLNFEGSITMEAWFRLSTDSARRLQNYVSIMTHGDQVHNTSLLVYTNQVYVVSKNAMGTGQATAQCSFNPAEWKSDTLAATMQHAPDLRLFGAPTHQCSLAFSLACVLVDFAVVTSPRPSTLRRPNGRCS